MVGVAETGVRFVPVKDAAHDEVFEGFSDGAVRCHPVNLTAAEEVVALIDVEVFRCFNVFTDEAAAFFEDHRSEVFGKVYAVRLLILRRFVGVPIGAVTEHQGLAVNVAPVMEGTAGERQRLVQNEVAVVFEDRAVRDVELPRMERRPGLDGGRGAQREGTALHVEGRSGSRGTFFRGCPLAVLIGIDVGGVDVAECHGVAPRHRKGAGIKPQVRAFVDGKRPDVHRARKKFRRRRNVGFGRPFARRTCEREACKIDRSAVHDAHSPVLA